MARELARPRAAASPSMVGCSQADVILETIVDGVWLQQVGYELIVRVLVGMERALRQGASAVVAGCAGAEIATLLAQIAVLQREVRWGPAGAIEDDGHVLVWVTSACAHCSASFWGAATDLQGSVARAVEAAQQAMPAAQVLPGEGGAALSQALHALLDRHGDPQAVADAT